MNSFRRLITFLSLSVFILFISDPILHAGGEEKGIIVSLGSTLGNCTTSNYHCEKIDDVNYICERNSELSSNQNTVLREIPTGQSQQISFTAYKGCDNNGIPTPFELGNNYKSPDIYLYPFVRIIKIQV